MHCLYLENVCHIEYHTKLASNLQDFNNIETILDVSTICNIVDLKQSLSSGEIDIEMYGWDQKYEKSRV